MTHLWHLHHLDWKKKYTWFTVQMFVEWQTLKKGLIISLFFFFLNFKYPSGVPLNTPKENNSIAHHVQMNSICRGPTSALCCLSDPWSGFPSMSDSFSFRKETSPIRLSFWFSSDVLRRSSCHQQCTARAWSHTHKPTNPVPLLLYTRHRVSSTNGALRMSYSKLPAK